jgi:glycosyltransferase involved in cell wall biosynthesis
MKPLILTFTSFYLPGYRGGGPIRTIANMVEKLSDDFDFRIVTTDRDFGDRQPYPNIHVDAWNDVGKAKVFYASAATCTLADFARLMRETPHDLLYLNSFFNPRFTLRPMFARWLGLVPKRPLVVAPRGEFSEGALRIKSWKKKPFIQLARIIGLFDGAYWHASTEMEVSDIQRELPVSAEHVRVPHNITVAPDLLQKTEHSPELKISNDESTGRALRVCFLSRIAPMKNLEYALGILARVNMPIDFNIYGPKEDAEYWGKCQTLIEDLPANIKVMYCGSVDHAEVKNVIGRHDIFFVPSRGENFGHVFMESLSAGVPILVSDQTPWRELQNRGLGWDIPLNQPENFVKAIEAAAQFSGMQRRQMKLYCLDFARQKADDPSALKLNRALFVQALASGC